MRCRFLLQPLLVAGACALSGCQPLLPPKASFATDGSFPDGSTETTPDGSASLLRDGGSVPDGATPMLDGGLPEEDAGEPGDSGPFSDAGSPSDAGEPTSDAGQLEDAGQPIGGSCSGNSDCASGNCITQVQGGYCVADCGNAGSCPSGSTCTRVVTGQQYCLQNCSSQSQCRQGFACQPTEGVCDLPCQYSFECPGGLTCNSNGQCVSASGGCSSDSQCPPGASCDVASGQCIQAASCSQSGDCPPGQTCSAAGVCATASSGCQSSADCPSGQTCNTATGVCGGQVGDSCAASSDCTVGSSPACYTTTEGFPGGYCVSSCQAFNPSSCPGNDRCVSGLNPNNGASVCVTTCASNADCRHDYQCVPFQVGFGGNPGICMPPCADNSVCAPGQQCDTMTGVCQGDGQTGGLNDGGL